MELICGLSFKDEKEVSWGKSALGLEFSIFQPLHLAVASLERCHFGLTDSLFTPFSNPSAGASIAALSI